MTEKKANEILRSKYPQAEILRKNSTSVCCRYWVTYQPNGKVYAYCAGSYQEVLGKLGFNILYKHNVETYNKRIAELSKQIEEGGEENLFHLFDERDWIPFSQEEIESKRAELEELQKELSEAIIC